MLAGNKGEWSEIYTLLKVLGDQQLFTGDAELNKVEDLFYQVLKVIRTESDGIYEYEMNGNLVFVIGTLDEIRIPIKTFQEKAVYLLQKIKSGSGSFKVPGLDDFLEKLQCSSLKAKSTKKTDIRILIHDSRINQDVELGFSIKSQLGGDSTLLNAGKTTNFVFKIQNFKGDTSDIRRINNIETKSKIKDRLSEIKKLGGSLEFTAPQQDIFKNNLVLIDSFLPNILSEIVKLFYTSNLNSIVDLTNEINKQNPLNYDKQFAHSFYEYKIKRFLTDVATGMMPSKVWGGEQDATGGYLIVKENGDVLCYHLYNRNQFENYLFYNTKLETASSTRHEFGTIYQENKTTLFRLNLQIRFK